MFFDVDLRRYIFLIIEIRMVQAMLTFCDKPCDASPNDVSKICRLAAPTSANMMKLVPSQARILFQKNYFSMGCCVFELCSIKLRLPTPDFECVSVIGQLNLINQLQKL